MNATFYILVIVLFSVCANCTWNTVTIPANYEYFNSLIQQGGYPNRTNSVSVSKVFHAAPHIPDMIDTGYDQHKPLLMMVDDEDTLYGYLGDRLFAYSSKLTIKWSTELYNEALGISLYPQGDSIYLMNYGNCLDSLNTASISFECRFFICILDITKVLIDFVKSIFHGVWNKRFFGLVHFVW